MGKFDFKKKQATPEWLTSILVKNGFLSKGEVSSIEQEIETTLSDIANASTFFSLKVNYSQESLGHLPSKILMKMMKPIFYDITQKEIDFYDDAMNTKVPLPLLTCYGTEKSPDIKQGYLLLENLTQTHHPIQAMLSLSQNQIEDAIKEAIAEAITVLAKVHAYWWNHSNFGESTSETHSGEGVRNAIRALENLYPQFADFLGDDLSEKRRKVYDLVFEKLPVLLGSRLSSTKRLTLLHGDAHLGNFLFPNHKNEGQCILLDWQNWEIGWGVKDLSYMITLNMSPEDRRTAERPILKFYLEELQKQQIDYIWEELETDYRICVIYNLLIPVMQYFVHVSSSIWRPNIERGFDAFEDLDCLELLRTV